MKLIIFGKLDFNHIYFLLYSLCTFIPVILKELLYENKNTISSYFYSMYVSILSRFLSLIPFLINKRLAANKNSKDNERNKSELKIKYIYNNKTPTKKIKLIISIFKVAIFEFLAEALICIFYFLNNKPEVQIIYPLQIFLAIDTITQYLVSHFVLDYTFYKHHYLSFGINIFCIIIFLIIDIIEIVDRKISDYQFYIYDFMRILKLFLFSFEDNYAKHALYTEFLNPFSLMVYMAIIESILLLIFSIPFIYIKTRDTNEIIFVDFVEYLKGTNFLLSLGILISNYLFETFLLIIIDKFSPSHLPLGFIFFSFCNNIYSLIKNTLNNKENKYYYYTNILLYIIIFIGAMIHNENIHN